MSFALSHEPVPSPGSRPVPLELLETPVPPAVDWLPRRFFRLFGNVESDRVPWRRRQLDCCLSPHFAPVRELLVVGNRTVVAVVIYSTQSFLES